jgi:hypothetical protein
VYRGRPTITGRVVTAVQGATIQRAIAPRAYVRGPVELAPVDLGPRPAEPVASDLVFEPSEIGAVVLRLAGSQALEHVDAAPIIPLAVDLHQALDASQAAAVRPLDEGHTGFGRFPRAVAGSLLLNR